MDPILQFKELQSSAKFELGMAAIRIKNLRLRTYIGFNPDELVKQQDVIINAKIEHQPTTALLTDDELEALNYKVITKQMITYVEQGKFRLLEKLAHDLLTMIMRHPQVYSAEITVDKPHALRFADSVAISLSASRE